MSTFEHFEREYILTMTRLRGGGTRLGQLLKWEVVVGQRADLILTKPVPSLAYLPHRFGENGTAKVDLKNS